MSDEASFDEWHKSAQLGGLTYENMLRTAWNASRKQTINECVGVVDAVNDKACEGFNTSPIAARTANEIANKLKDLK